MWEYHLVAIRALIYAFIPSYQPMIIPFTACITRKSGSTDLGTMTAEMLTEDGRCIMQQLTYSACTEKASMCLFFVE